MTDKDIGYRVGNWTWIRIWDRIDTKYGDSIGLDLPEFGTLPAWTLFLLAERALEVMNQDCG